jgi:nicotinate-nucleotide--dimethylbenzimidazole phosphoribosyltransferase
MTFPVPTIVPTVNPALEAQIVARLNDLTKPVGSLGRLEEFVIRYCLCRGNADASIYGCKIFTFAGDHGITKQGVAPYPPEVTRQMVLNMLGGGAAISVLCRNAGIDYAVVDVGVSADFEDQPLLIKSKVGRGTADFSTGPAMTTAECEKAIAIGFDLSSGFRGDLLGTGEMGIGNSSSAAALYSLLLEGVNPAETVGVGTGAAGDLLERKRAVIVHAVEKHRGEWDGTPVDALRRVGGFEVAAMTGLILGAATKRIPVVVDGFIASSAALVAMKMHPSVKEYLFFAHESSEKFHADFLRSKGITPILHLGMRLGEGTGAVLAMQIIQQALHCYHEMATFSQAKVSQKT